MLEEVNWQADGWFWDAAPAGTLPDHPNPLIQDAEGLRLSLDVLLGDEPGDDDEVDKRLDFLERQLAAQLEWSLGAQGQLNEHEARIRRLERSWFQRVGDRLRGRA